MDRLAASQSVVWRGTFTQPTHRIHIEDDMAHDEHADELARVFGDLAVKLEEQSDAEATLQAIVDSSVNLVPGARWAGISMMRDVA